MSPVNCYCTHYNHSLLSSYSYVHSVHKFIHNLMRGDCNGCLVLPVEHTEGGALP